MIYNDSKQGKTRGSTFNTPQVMLENKTVRKSLRSLFVPVNQNFGVSGCFGRFFVQSFRRALYRLPQQDELVWVEGGLVGERGHEEH